MGGSGLPMANKLFIRYSLSDHYHRAGVTGKEIFGKQHRSHGVCQSHLARQDIDATGVRYPANAGKCLQKNRWTQHR